MPGSAITDAAPWLNEATIAPIAEFRTRHAHCLYNGLFLDHF